jgi:hypothetical protein
MHKLKLLFFVLLFATSCRNSHEGLVTIGIYSFDFPKNFSLIEEKGIDSYVGKVTNKNISLDFDYGYYSNKLILTPEEYLDRNIWLEQFIDNSNQETPDDKRVNKSDFTILNIRKANFNDKLNSTSSEYVATLKRKQGTQFEYSIQIPETINAYSILKDTIQNCLRKIVLAKDPQKGITGIYLQNLNGFNKSINSSLALSMSTSSLTKQQQDSVLKIFYAVKINPQ